MNHFPQILQLSRSAFDPSDLASIFEFFVDWKQISDSEPAAQI